MKSILSLAFSALLLALSSFGGDFIVLELDDYSNDYSEKQLGAVSNIDDLSPYCKNVLNELKVQPETKDIIYGISRTLTLANRDDGNICEFIFNKSRAILGHMANAGYDINNRIHSNRSSLTLKYYKDSAKDKVDILEKVFPEVIQGLKNGWKSVESNNYPNIQYKQDPSQFNLYIKQDGIKALDHTFRFIAHRFGLENDVKFSNLTNDSSSLFMWVRASKIDVVREILKFDI